MCSVLGQFMLRCGMCKKIIEFFSSRIFGLQFRFLICLWFKLSSILHLRIDEVSGRSGGKFFIFLVFKKVVQWFVISLKINFKMEV